MMPVCREKPVLSTCENPVFPPSWPWRYNRNKHLSRFEPWKTRVEQWPPRYRNMGVRHDFEFKVDHSPNAPLHQAKLTFADQLATGRQTGYGNAGLGNPPGPAPPVLRVYSRDITVTQDCHTGAPGGDRPALNPRQYLQETLNQEIDHPGIYPACIPINEMSAGCPERSCGSAAGPAGPRDPLALWRQRHHRNIQQAELDRMAQPRDGCSGPHGAPDSGIARADWPVTPISCGNNNNSNNNSGSTESNESGELPVGHINIENNVFGNNTDRCLSDSLSDHYRPSDSLHPGTSYLVAHHQSLGARSDVYPLANF